MAWPGIESFTVKYDGTDIVYAAHINALQNSVVNIESTVGATPLTVDDTVDPAVSWSTIEGIVDRLASQIKYITGKSSWRTRPDYTLGGIGTFGSYIIQGTGALAGGGALSGSPLSITLNTPGTLSLTSTNSSASAHTHAVTSTISGEASKLVGTDSTGKIVGTGLRSNGAVEIYGNLNVNSAMYVDYTNRRVGINCIADAQFALDVNGNFRARGYIVGKHAITLQDCSFLLHFDGPLPYNTNKTGNLTSHFGHKGTPLRVVPSFNEGKFNKCIQIDCATTNLITNSTFETDVSGWTIPASATGVQDPNFSWQGTKSVKVTPTVPGAYGYIYQTKTVTSGVWYTLSAWVYLPEITGVRNINYSIRITTTGGGDASFPMADVPIGRWTRVTCRLQATSTSMTIWLFGFNSSSPIYYDAVQLENLSICTPYQSSTSAVSANRIDYASAPLNLQQGSIGFWRRSYATNFSAAIPNLNWFNYGVYNVAHYQWINIQNAVSGSVVAFIYDNKENATAYAVQTSLHNDGEWHFYTFTWEDGGYLKIYSDGVLVATGSTVLVTMKNPKEYAIMYLERGLYEVDEFFITTSALAADAIKAIYESEAPLFVETSNWQFTIPGGLSWADETGFWVKDASENGVFGACAIDGVTWGGLTLNKGDVLIGNTNHYLFWDTSVPELKFYSTGGKLQINKEGVFGLDASSKPTFSLLSAAKTVNSEALLAGDVLFGDNSASKANIKFTAGDILLRTGTTNSLKLTNDGKLSRVIGASDTYYQDQWIDTAGTVFGALLGWYSGTAPNKKVVLDWRATILNDVNYTRANIIVGINKAVSDTIKTTWFANDSAEYGTNGIQEYLGVTSGAKYSIKKGPYVLFEVGSSNNNTIIADNLNIESVIGLTPFLKMAGRDDYDDQMPFRIYEVSAGKTIFTKNAYTVTDGATWASDTAGLNSIQILFSNPAYTESFVVRRGTTSAGVVTWGTSALFTDAVNNRVGINKDSPAVTLDVVGSQRLTQTLQITGILSPANGEGLELSYVTNQGYITAYRRDATAGFKPLNLRGDPVYIGTTTPATAVTPLGGIAILFTAGENLTKGQIVQSSQSVSNRVIKVSAAGDMPIGVVYADATSGNTVWIVVAGLGEVKFASGVAPLAGYVAYVHATTAGEANCATTIPGTTEHWREVGHIKLTGTTGGLGTCILHFN